MSSTYRPSFAESPSFAEPVAPDVGATSHHIRDDGSVIEICLTGRDDGDFALGASMPGLRERRAAVMAGRWAVVTQVHGSSVIDADPALVLQGDALITSTVGQPIAVQGADCAPIAFITDHGPLAVAHAGWRGLVDGVIDATIERLREGGARTCTAIVGPTIGPECYAFGADDLDHVASVLGDSVRGVTAAGEPALDLRAGIATALAAHEVHDVRFVGGCTACENAGFSHRARGENERHTLVARIVPSGRR